MFNKLKKRKKKKILTDMEEELLNKNHKKPMKYKKDLKEKTSKYQPKRLKTLLHIKFKNHTLKKVKNHNQQEAKYQKDLLLNNPLLNLILNNLKLNQWVDMVKEINKKNLKLHRNWHLMKTKQKRKSQRFDNL